MSDEQQIAENLQGSQQQTQPQVIPAQSSTQFHPQAAHYHNVAVPQQTVYTSQVKPAPQRIQGGSRVEYFPIERRAMEYEQVEKSVFEQVPKQVIEYETVTKKYTESIPKEKVWTDYQAVEYQKQYIPRTVFDTVQEQVPVERVEYVPVQRTEYVAQEKTEYITQSKQVERIEYDEVEYQVQRPQVQQVQAPVQVLQQSRPVVVQQQQPVQPLVQSQVIATQPQVVAQQPQVVYTQPQTVQYAPMTTSYIRPQQSVYRPAVQQPKAQETTQAPPRKATNPGILDQIFD